MTLLGLFTELGPAYFSPSTYPYLSKLWLDNGGRILPAPLSNDPSLSPLLTIKKKPQSENQGDTEIDPLNLPVLYYFVTSTDPIIPHLLKRPIIIFNPEWIYVCVSSKKLVEIGAWIVEPRHVSPMSWQFKRRRMDHPSESNLGRCKRTRINGPEDGDDGKRLIVRFDPDPIEIDSYDSNDDQDLTTPRRDHEEEEDQFTQETSPNLDRRMKIFQDETGQARPQPSNRHQDFLPTKLFLIDPSPSSSLPKLENLRLDTRLQSVFKRVKPKQDDISQQRRVHQNNTSSSRYPTNQTKIRSLPSNTIESRSILKPIPNTTEVTEPVFELKHVMDLLLERHRNIDTSEKLVTNDGIRWAISQR